MLNERLFREAMGSFTTGVTVITTLGDQSDIHGMTANALMSVSLDPQLLLISIDQHSQTLDRIQQSGKFSISILCKHQEHLSRLFSGHCRQDPIDFAWFDGMPVIKEAVAWLNCRVYDTFTVGDHTLFVGEVLNVRLEDTEPLVYFKSQYYSLDHKKE